MGKHNRSTASYLPYLGLGLLLAASTQAQTNLNPNHFYLVQGELIGRSIGKL